MKAADASRVRGLLPMMRIPKTTGALDDPQIISPNPRRNV